MRFVLGSIALFVALAVGWGYFFCGTLLYSLIGWWMMVPDLLGSMLAGFVYTELFLL